MKTKICYFLAIFFTKGNKGKDNKMCEIADRSENILKKNILVKIFNIY